MRNIDELETEIGYAFRDKGLLGRALTHSSFANESRGSEQSNERLEFLGDSVLSMIVSEHLFLERADMPEGELTKNRASLVREESLYGFAESIGLGEYLKLGKGERRAGGNGRPSILADAFEALLAAVYLDGGYAEAERFVLKFTETRAAAAGGRDYKTLLQEAVQRDEKTAEYSVIEESGPEHSKSFTVEVKIGGRGAGTGLGHSKKSAEQNAAKEALKSMGYEETR